MSALAGPKIKAKDAVNAVREFLKDLYDANELRFTMVEEIEFVPTKGEWFVTMSFTSASKLVLSPSQKDFKTFRVNANSGAVISMRMKER